MALTVGWGFVRRGKVRAHRAAMLTAVVASAGFFVGYVLHHAQVGSVRFVGEGLGRLVYFAVLIPHAVLAAVLLPMVLVTLSRGLRDRRAAHRSVARWTLPIWWFVSVSGIGLYFALYRW